MAFGQPSGPPATRRQLEELRDLLARAGHVDFRDARGPMGFSQRQAGGKFTRDEADEFIARLTEELEGRGADQTASEQSTRVVERLSPAEEALRAIPDARLAGELQRRGWIVVAPD